MSRYRVISAGSVKVQGHLSRQCQGTESSYLSVSRYRVILTCSVNVHSHLSRLCQGTESSQQTVSRYSVISAGSAKGTGSQEAVPRHTVYELQCTAVLRYKIIVEDSVKVLSNLSGFSIVQGFLKRTNYYSRSFQLVGY